MLGGLEGKGKGGERERERVLGGIGKGGISREPSFLEKIICIYYSVLLRKNVVIYYIFLFTIMWLCVEF